MAQGQQGSWVTTTGPRLRTFRALRISRASIMAASPVRKRTTTSTSGQYDLFNLSLVYLITREILKMGSSLVAVG